MFFSSDVIFLPFLISFLITALTTPIALWFIKKFGLVDDPKRLNHPGIIHKLPVARGGGIPLFLGAFVASILFIPFTNTMIAVFFASFLALIIGLIDDKLNAQSKDVSPYLRFLVNILCAIIVVGSGVTIPFITNPFGGILHFEVFKFIFLGIHYSIALNDIIAVCWIIWVMNMLNWSKGVNGQMPGIVAISAITIGLISLRFPLSDPTTRADVLLSFIIAGASVGFLLFNFYPKTIIFPGYGATAIYLLLAVVSILSTAKLATAILVMGVPIVDGTFTIIRRVLNKKSPFKGDKLHLHHLLLQLGYTDRQIALFYWCLSGILGLASLTLQSRSKLFAIIMLVVIVSMILVFLHRIVRQISHET